MNKISKAIFAALFASLNAPPASAADQSPPANAEGAPAKAEQIIPPQADPAAPHILIYPPIANWNEMQGSAIVEMAVGSDGWVTDARIVTSSGYVQLDAAALVTVGYWHYLPARKGLLPIASQNKAMLRFVINHPTAESYWAMRPEPPIPAADSQVEIPTDTSHFLLYPQMARRTAQHGDVTLNILVRAEGYISDAQIVRSSGYTQLDGAALISVGYWNYLPAIRAGVAIDAWKTVTVHFAPPDSGPEAEAAQFGPTMPTVPFTTNNGVSHVPSAPPIIPAQKIN